MSEEQLQEQARQSREKLADQTHPHSENEHKDVEESNLRKENQRVQRLRHVRFDDTYNERRPNIIEEESQGDYAEMEMEGKVSELESCPYGCPYKSSDIWLIKAHLTRCPYKDSQTGTSEMPLNMQNQNIW